MTETMNGNVVETGEVVAPVAVGIKRPRLPLEVKAGRIAQKSLLTRWREENHAPKRGSLGVEQYQNVSSFLAQHLEEEKAVVLRDLESKVKVPKVRTRKTKVSSLPGHIYQTVSSAKDENGNLEVTMRFVGPDGEALAAKIVVGVGKKDPRKPVVRGIEVSEIV